MSGAQHGRGQKITDENTFERQIRPEGECALKIYVFLIPVYPVLNNFVIRYISRDFIFLMISVYSDLTRNIQLYKYDFKSISYIFYTLFKCTAYMMYYVIYYSVREASRGFFHNTSVRWRVEF